jgi:hypothetical protein
MAPRRRAANGKAASVRRSRVKAEIALRTRGATVSVPASRGATVNARPSRTRAAAVNALARASAVRASPAGLAPTERQA